MGEGCTIQRMLMEHGMMEMEKADALSVNGMYREITS